MKKAVCIVQARMGSSRLQGKVMKEILKKPMISYVLNRLKKSEALNDIVLATSLLESDNPVAEYVAQLGFNCFRGSESDVLERYVMANRKYGGDIVIRVTGDCPLVDPQLVDITVNAFCRMDKDYVSLDVKNSAVLGLNVEVFSAEALERVYKTVSSLDDFKNYKEHVTIYMYRHPNEFSIGSVKAPGNILRDYRLCIDELDDFRVVESVYNHFLHPYPTAEQIIDYLDKNPNVALINKRVMQKTE